MAYGVVASQAADFAAAVAAGVNGLHDVAMTAAAGVFGYVAAGSADLNVVWKVTGSEVKRMEETVACFYGVFSGKVVRGVAIVASGGVLVASFDPAIVLRIHDMAVGTSLGIVGEIGIALGVNKCVAAMAPAKTASSSVTGTEFFIGPS